MFAARLAPRASRVPVAPAAAMQACYFDENRQIDEAGAALIKAVGIYQPGSYVRLTSDEVAVVVRRGANTSTPRVAVVLNRSGMPTVEPTIRDTGLKEYRVVASVAHRDVKVQINLDRMLPLTAEQPKCMIGFAGPRVVKETTHQNLPPGFQTAEFMLEHGLIDAIVPRSKLRSRLGSLLSYMMPQ